MTPAGPTAAAIGELGKAFWLTFGCMLIRGGRCEVLFGYCANVEAVGVPASVKPPPPRSDA